MRLKSIKQNKLENRKRSKAFILLVAVILLIAAGSTLYEVQANGHYLFPELNNENLPANKRAELTKEAVKALPSGLS